MKQFLSGGKRLHVDRWAVLIVVLAASLVSAGGGPRAEASAQSSVQASVQTSPWTPVQSSPWTPVQSSPWTPVQSSPWTVPVMLGPGWFPDIAADASGRIHLAWASVKRSDGSTGLQPTGEPNPNFDIVSYATYLPSKGWSEVYDIAASRQRSGSEVTRPSILIDERGAFHMTYRDTTVYYAQSTVYSAYSARTWSRPYQVSVDQVAYFSDLARDSQGSLHLIFTENVRSESCDICYHIYYRYSEDNGRNWSIRTDLSDLPTGAAKPQILLDADDNLHVVWEAGRGGSYGQLTDPTSVLYTASYDGGSTWTRPAEFVVPDGKGKNITIGQDARGHLIVAYLALPADQIVFQVSSNQGRSWSEPKPIPGIWGGWRAYTAHLDDYHMVSDSDGNVHLVAAGRVTEEQRDLDLLHLTWNGSVWLSHDIITTLTGDVPEWPRAAVANGNELHVTWFVRDQEHIFDSDRGVYTIWHSTRTIVASRLNPQPLPTFTPTLSPTPGVTEDFTNPTPTPPDPSIALTPISPSVRASIYSEWDEMGLIAVALIPTAALVLLVFALVRLRQR